MRRKASYQGYLSKYYTVRPLALVAYEMGVPAGTLQEAMRQARVRTYKEDGGPMVVGDRLRQALRRNDEKNFRK